MTVDRFGNLPDCLTFSAMVFRTTVQDSDGDGLLDIWETSQSLVDPNGNALPNLAAMGANPNRKDLLSRLATWTPPRGRCMAGWPNRSTRIYPGRARSGRWQRRLTQEGSRFTSTSGTTTSCRWAATHHPGEPRARRPEHFRDEGLSSSPDPAQADTAKPVECATFNGDGSVATQGDIPGQYPKYPGTVGWKTGFQLIRDELLGVDPDTEGHLPLRAVRPLARHTQGALPE